MGFGPAEVSSPWAVPSLEALSRFQEVTVSGTVLNGSTTSSYKVNGSPVSEQEFYRKCK